jgi:hypothetical protein
MRAGGPEEAGGMGTVTPYYDSPALWSAGGIQHPGRLGLTDLPQSTARDGGRQRHRLLLIPDSAGESRELL